jgi:hypothetical protein
VSRRDLTPTDPDEREDLFAIFRRIAARRRVEEADA